METKEKPQKEIKDSQGNYHINNGYKHISGGNAAETLELIKAQLERIQSESCVLSARKSYRVRSHEENSRTAILDEYNKARQKKPFRKEEWICKLCVGSEFATVGKVVDYQVPLKHTSHDECDGLGKIDLLSQKGNEGFLLELKVPDSHEEPLRAIMEIYTYWRQLGGLNCQNFLKNSMLSGADKLRKAIVIYEGSTIFKKLVSAKKELLPLMKALEVDCFLAVADKENDDWITDIVKCKL